MINLILSLDYELFGNGSGDVRRDMIDPTERLLHICGEYGAKMTIMFEVGEYLAFEQHDSQLRNDLGYSPCEQMRKQAIEAIDRGHDVQLHVHPQWFGVGYRQGVWQLRDSCWRLGDLPACSGENEEVVSICDALSVGKQTIEDMIRPVKPDYECVCLRAGGFYAQPSQNIIRAMKKVGLKADSSVVKGYRTTAPFAVDYSHVDTMESQWWTTDSELTAEGKPGENILELCVSSRMEPYWKSFTKTKLRAARKMRRIERQARGNHSADRSLSAVPGYRTVIKRLLRKRANIFDFCRLSSKDMLDRIEEHAPHPEQPVVVVGHSKNFFNDREFDRFLESLCRRGKVTFLTMSEYVQIALKALDISSSTAGVSG